MGPKVLNIVEVCIKILFPSIVRITAAANTEIEYRSIGNLCKHYFLDIAETINRPVAP